MALKNVPLSKINQFVKQGWVSRKKHPVHDLWILNYTPSVQYDDLWDEDELLVHMRGIVVDRIGNVIARGFPKFWNQSEERSPIHPPYHSDGMRFFEKMDGSLGLAFIYNKEWVTATRGSFESEQALWLSNYLSEATANDILKPSPFHTFLFEIIYDENRIVVDYEFEEPVLLSMYDNQFSTFCVERNILEMFWDGRIVKEYATREEAMKLSRNREGYVIWHEDLPIAKVKFDEYIMLHKLRFQTTKKSIWESMAQNRFNINELYALPDEFGAEFIDYATELLARFNSEMQTYLTIFDGIMRSFDGTRSDFAERAKNFDNPSILFAMLDKKPDTYYRIIWDTLKPTKGE
jgi:RNA ligase